MEKTLITRANETSEHYWKTFSVVVLRGSRLSGWDLWHGRADPCDVAWTVRCKPEGEVLVSVGPVKAAVGAQHESSPIAAGLVSVISLKCLLNMSCRHQSGPDLARGVTSCYAFG